MNDLCIELDHQPGALARMGEVLGAKGLSVEGGGVWSVDGRATAHFLFEDGAAAAHALREAGMVVHAVNDVLVQRLKQDVPGQLGKIARRMADAGVNIEAMYSDHDHRLILVVDNYAAGREVSEAWERERAEHENNKGGGH
ncbi:MAG TPA: amino acid-binding protein [Trinickia sp.]|uniref:amino acid-binding protein n=1 Tax=Trinickia sp. TaxID=2571163 RepID=UPI002F40E353